MAKGLEDVPEGGERCFRCYRLRMEEAAKLAKEGGYDYFTTTLSISPLKNAQKINEIGEELAEIYKVPHLMSMLCTGRITAAVYFQRKKPWTENGWLLRTE